MDKTERYNIMIHCLNKNKKEQTRNINFGELTYNQILYLEADKMEFNTETPARSLTIEGGQVYKARFLCK